MSLYPAVGDIVKIKPPTIKHIYENNIYRKEEKYNFHYPEEISIGTKLKIIRTIYNRGYTNHIIIKHKKKEFKFFPSEVDIIKLKKLKPLTVENGIIKTPLLKSLRCPHIRFGADPEVFIVDKNNELLPADNFLPNKEKGKQINLFFDGIQAEMNILSNICRQSIQSYLAVRINELLNIIKVKNKDAKIVIAPCLPIKKEVLLSAHPDARIFGCEPDFNGYKKGKPNKVSIIAEKHYVRYAGGHLHFGFPETYSLNIFQENVVDVVKLLDLFISNTFVMLDKDTRNKDRRKLYGRAGDFRVPDYGIEYRTPSSFWLIHPALTSLALGLGRLALCYYISGYYNEIMSVIDEEELQDAINNNNYNLAVKNYKKIRNLFNISETVFYIYSRLVKSQIPINKDNIYKFEKIVLSNGKYNILKLLKADNLAGNWNLKIKKNTDMFPTNVCVGCYYTTTSGNGFQHYLSYMKNL